MKLKSMNIVLLSAMSVIWFFVIERAIRVWSIDPNDTTDIPEKNFINPIPILEKDTFELTFLDRDPFLEYKNRKVSTKVKTNTKSPKKNNRPLLRQRIVKEEWPKLQYFGYLKGSVSSEKLALIKIDNKLHRIRRNSSVQNIKVVKVYKDSVILNKDGAIKSIEKNN
ncbi:MAG: hypothetical protein GYB37_14475 [Algicola sp.]|nr:hypothetical protein [Algicola sp.]